MSAPDPERPGALTGASAAIDRDDIDDTRCYDHFAGGWTASDRGSVGSGE